MKNAFCRTSHGPVFVIDTQGAGRPVLLIHGNSLSSESYKPQLESELGARWRLIAFDFPGHGQSPPAADPVASYRLAPRAAIVREVAESLGVRRPILVGHSLGGHVALEAAGSGFDIAGLLIFGTPPFRTVSEVASGFLPPVAEGILFRAHPTMEEMQRAARSFMPPGTLPPEYYARSLAATDGGCREQIAADIAVGEMVNECEVARRMGQRAAIVHGEHDQLISLPFIESLDLPLWRGAVQVIKGAGHCPQHDTPEEFNLLLQQFLTELPS
jgi:pimeloyl-ACP methyl ester carboxylesterase